MQLFAHAKRLIRELFSLLLVLVRPRFRLIHLLLAMVVASLVFEIATYLDWFESSWLENVGLLAIIAFGLSLVVNFLWFDGVDIIVRRRKPRPDVHVQLPPEQAEQTPGKPAKSKIRLPNTKRQISGFKW